MTGSGSESGWMAARALLAQAYFAAMFFVAAPAVIQWWWGDGFDPSWNATSTTGAIAIVSGNLFVLYLVGRFLRQGRGTQVPLDPPRRMLASGAYGRTRNPMYLTYVVIIIGEALWLDSWRLVVYALVFWAIFHLYVVGREEPLLLRRFGPTYAVYMQSVPRWLPSLRISSDSASD
jgi:protein-S-isoprenylcysteine O-methyltransferase Ste14